MLNTYIKTIDIFTDNDQFNNFVEDKRYLTGIKSN